VTITPIDVVAEMAIIIVEVGDMRHGLESETKGRRSMIRSTTELLELATIALENRDEDALLELFNTVDENLGVMINSEAKAAFKKLLWTMADAASVLERL
jgi:hypothetical protein|tara:strand:+ start:2447 stop:2746 length:300 start_codon:yes stop_codon:yes gene_type:complete